MMAPLEIGEVNRLGMHFVAGAGECKRFMVLYAIELSDDGGEIHFDFKHRTTPKRHRVSSKIAERGIEYLEGIAFSVGADAGDWARDEDVKHVLGELKLMPGLLVVEQ